MSKLESVAVIIPAFNAAPYLAEAIESALHQVCPPERIIVIDDGSTDATPQVLQRFSDSVIAMRQENAGVSSARNLGAGAAQNAEWMLFLDADDRLVPTALERLAARSERLPECGIVFGQSLFFSDAGGPSRIHGDGACEGPVPTAARVNFWQSVIATPGAALIRKDIFQAVGGFVSEWSPVEDRDFWIKAGTLTEFGFLPELVIEKRLHEANASRLQNRMRIQGTRVQLAFAQWSHARGQDPSVLSFSATEIIERNLNRSLDERLFGAAEWLCQEADRRGLRLPAVKSARRLLALPAVIRSVFIAARGRLRSLHA